MNSHKSASGRLIAHSGEARALDTPIRQPRRALEPARSDHEVWWMSVRFGIGLHLLDKAQTRPPRLPSGMPSALSTDGILADNLENFMSSSNACRCSVKRGEKPNGSADVHSHDDKRTCYLSCRYGSHCVSQVCEDGLPSAAPFQGHPLRFQGLDALERVGGLWFILSIRLECR